jgi:hypothetical protein
VCVGKNRKDLDARVPLNLVAMHVAVMVSVLVWDSQTPGKGLQPDP